MRIETRRLFSVFEERLEQAGHQQNPPLRRMAIIAVVENPYAGRYVDDLKPMIDASVALGEQMAAHLGSAFAGNDVQSYGKGGLVGTNGEQEHANALLTTAFANPFRKVIGRADAWISSFTKICVPGTQIDIPMNHKDDVYVRSHYDGMTLALADTPMPDEIALIFCVANRGRLNARVGGLTHGEVQARLKGGTS
jgi:hypothetical protein